MEDVVHEKMTDAIRFVFLELGRFKKRISERETVFEKWIYLVKNMHRMAEIDNFTPYEMRQQAWTEMP